MGHGLSTPVVHIKSLHTHSDGLTRYSGLCFTRRRFAWHPRYYYDLQCSPDAQVLTEMMSCLRAADLIDVPRSNPVRFRLVESDTLFSGLDVAAACLAAPQAYKCLSAGQRQAPVSASVGCASAVDGTANLGA